jgi:hypothetical protein
MGTTFPDNGAMQNFLVEENLCVPRHLIVVLNLGHNVLSKTHHRRLWTGLFIKE